MGDGGWLTVGALVYRVGSSRRMLVVELDPETLTVICAWVPGTGRRPFEQRFHASALRREPV